MTATEPRTIGQQPLDVPKPDTGDLTCWSVTTILGVLDKPALMYWAAEQTAEAAIDSATTWRGMLADRGREETIKWLRDARFRQPKDRLASTALGTVVHQMCEAYALTGTRPDPTRIGEAVIAQGGQNIDVRAETGLVGRMLDRFEEWAQRFQPAYDAAEVTVYTPTYGVAGTADGFLRIGDTRLIIDYKTSREPYDTSGRPKTPYPEVALQLAAYRYAEKAAVWRPRRYERFRRRYYLLSPSERELAVDVPTVDGAACIHITPESCEAFPVRANQEVYRFFLHVLEVARWRFEAERDAIGEPLVEASAS